jgi:hypothetical protein
VNEASQPNADVEYEINGADTTGVAGELNRWVAKIFDDLNIATHF